MMMMMMINLLPCDMPSVEGGAVEIEAVRTRVLTKIAFNICQQIPSWA